jgi:hypothetical protein
MRFSENESLYRGTIDIPRKPLLRIQNVNESGYDEKLLAAREENPQLSYLPKDFPVYVVVGDRSRNSVLADLRREPHHKK